MHSRSHLVPSRSSTFFKYKPDPRRELSAGTVVLSAMPGSPLVQLANSIVAAARSHMCPWLELMLCHSHPHPLFLYQLFHPCIYPHQSCPSQMQNGSLESRIKNPVHQIVKRLTSAPIGGYLLRIKCRYSPMCNIPLNSITATRIW